MGATTWNSVTISWSGISISKARLKMASVI